MIIQYFGAEWCNPCKALRPIVEEAAKENKCKFVYYDVQEDIDVCRKLSVMGTPTVIFKNGDKEERIVGIKSKEEIQSIINSLL